MSGGVCNDRCPSLCSRCLQSYPPTPARYGGALTKCRTIIIDGIWSGRDSTRKWLSRTLSKLTKDTYLPLLRIPQRKSRRLRSNVVPLFPCYLFALIDFTFAYHKIQRTPGVVNLVSAGSEPLEVDECVIDLIKKRATDGIVELPLETLRRGESVEILHGPLRGLSGVFERYLSGLQRVRLLVTLIGAASVRVVAPTTIVARSRDEMRHIANGRL